MSDDSESDEGTRKGQARVLQNRSRSRSRQGGRHRGNSKKRKFEEISNSYAGRDQLKNELWINKYAPVGLVSINMEYDMFV